MSRANLALEVEVLLGTAIGDAAASAVELADRLGVIVRFDFNDKTFRASPGSDPAAIVAAYHGECGLPNPPAEAYRRHDR